jgi:hypothetical protein
MSWTVGIDFLLVWGLFPLKMQQLEVYTDHHAEVKNLHSPKCFHGMYYTQAAGVLWVT